MKYYVLGIKNFVAKKSGKETTLLYVKVSDCHDGTVGESVDTWFAPDEQIKELANPALVGKEVLPNYNFFNGRAFLQHVEVVGK